MNKIISIIFVAMFVVPKLAVADDVVFPKLNPFMGNYQNQMAFGIGQGFDTGLLIPPPYKPVPFYIGSFQYSQPTSFFRAPARRSINISQTVGTGSKNGWNWAHFSIPMAYLTEEVALFRYHKLYMGTGAGAGLQAHQNERLGAKLIFTLKITLGYNFNKQWAGEFFIQHFSNANTDHKNYSYAFYGIGFTKNF